MIKNPRRNVVWPSHIIVDGNTWAIRDLIESNQFELYFCGSAAAEGWAAYITPIGDNDKHQQVSPAFWIEYGEKLGNLIDAAERAYGVRMKKRAALDFFPAEQWNWQTVEPLKAEQAPARAVVESRPYSWNELTQAEQAEATFRGFEREAGTRYIVNKAARDSESLLVRFVPHYVPRNAAPVVIQHKAELIKQTPAQARDISAADDIAFWTLEACKRPEVPLWNNLDIPADVAEDIDAANWTVGSGIKDATGRREVFRKRRAEARAAMFPDEAAEEAAQAAAKAAQPSELEQLRAENERLTTALIAVDVLASGFHSAKQIRAWAAEENVKTKREIAATISAALNPVELPAPCHCTTIQQDESCPIGYPSLLCEDCDSKGSA